MIELLFLLISSIIIIFIIYKNNIDNFADYSKFDTDNYYLSACPSGYKSFYNNNGDTICCNGEVIVNKCIGNLQCTLNGKGTDMPNCLQYILEDYKEKGNKFCPRSFAYFQDENTKGCTNGLLNKTLTGPRNDSQEVCTIYKTDELNKTSIDSCYNKKLLDKAECMGDNCTKKLTQFGKGMPVLIQIEFIHNNNPIVAYTRASFSNLINTVNPNMKKKDEYLSKNIHIAEVAKALYIDRTMEESEVDFKW